MGYYRCECIDEFVLFSRFGLLDDLCISFVSSYSLFQCLGRSSLPFARYTRFSLLLGVDSFSRCIHSCAVRSACLLRTKGHVSWWTNVALHPTRAYLWNMIHCEHVTILSCVSFKADSFALTASSVYAISCRLCLFKLLCTPSQTHAKLATRRLQIGSLQRVKISSRLWGRCNDGG